MRSEIVHLQSANREAEQIPRVGLKAKIGVTGVVGAEDNDDALSFVGA